MKCWNSAFNAQGSRLIIVVVQLGAVKIYVAALEALRKKGKTGWNSVYDQNWWFSEFHRPLNANVLFCRFSLNLILCMTKLRVLVLCFSYFTDNSLSQELPLLHTHLVWLVKMRAERQIRTHFSFLHIAIKNID